MRWRISTLFLVSFLATGCGSSDSQTPSVADTDSGADASQSTVFQADAIPDGPSLSIDVDTSHPEAPVARVVGHQLGSVFGIACHVVFTGSTFSAHDPVVQPFLGADEAGKARYLAKASPTEVALAGVRRGVAAGEIELPDPVVIGTVPIAIGSAGTVRIELSQAQVRRADGTWTAVKLAGGNLQLGGAP